MVTTLERPIEEQLDQELETIRSKYWELPVCNLGQGKYLWRPGTAYLSYNLFEGPDLSKRTHGINLEKDMCIGIHGARGATKTCSNSYLVAKKLRMGQPAWTNWPVSFWVIEPECWDRCQEYWKCPECQRGYKTYYESMPMDFDKLYTFNSEISGGVAGITELQYYAEARTSIRTQNRFLSYQIMQIRKSALSFFYDVQNEEWADRRFSWSDDIKIYCSDVARMNYDSASIDHDIQEGEYSHWMIKDISGIATGKMWKDTGIQHGPYQFDSFHFWPIYPTHWKIDVYEAVYSMKKQSGADREAAIGNAIALAVDSFLEDKVTKVLASDLWARASSLGNVNIPPAVGGKILSAYGIKPHMLRGGKNRDKNEYDLSVFLQQGAENEK